ncbi:hypothetical protein BH23BAC1_BH23BAC1_01800 [soil metagenome]
MKTVAKGSFLYLLLSLIGLTIFIRGFFFIFELFDLTDPLVHTFINEIIFYSALIAFVVAAFNYLIFRSGENFISMVLVSTVIRMLLSIIVIMVLLLRGTDRILVLLINFFIVYLIYLLFEIYNILANLRRISKKDIK